LILSFQLKYQQIIDEYQGRNRKVEDPSLLLVVAKARIRLGDFNGALSNLSTVISLGVINDPMIYLQKGICYQNLEKWVEAEAEFTLCIRLTSKFSKAYYRRGICRLYTNQRKTGLDDLNAAIRIDPNYFDAYISRASHYHSIGKYIFAIEDCNSALSIEPTSISALLIRGSSKCKLNQFARSISDFTRAISNDRVFKKLT
jgi:tetratricopeptide (TPR) repeat protein